jgi:prevent-host-death family protein
MTAPASQIGVRELRGKLSEVLRKVQNGEAFLVVSRGAAIAELRGVACDRPTFRKAGALAGKMWMADDFDALPDDMLDSIEREPL